MPTETPRIHLQGIGLVPAKAASELQIGDITVWNYGYTHRVLAVEIKGAWVTLRLESSSEPGKVWTRRKRATTLVAVARHKPVQGMIANEDFSE